MSEVKKDLEVINEDFKNEETVTLPNTNEVDDGTLSFLKIPKKEDNRQLLGKETTQSKLVNTTFWVFGFVDNIETKFTKIKKTSGQMLIQIRPEKDSLESESQKFFTGSEFIKNIMYEIKKRNAFPRKMTLRSEGNKFYVE